MARESGFEIESFYVQVPGKGVIKLINKAIQKFPLTRNSILGDILSLNVSAVLVKK